MFEYKFRICLELLSHICPVYVGVQKVYLFCLGEEKLLCVSTIHLLRNKCYSLSFVCLANVEVRKKLMSNFSTGEKLHDLKQHRS
jgi:hypothetical protein